MLISTRFKIPHVLLPLLLAGLMTGCASTADLDEFSNPLSGFQAVSDKTAQTAKKQTVWIQSQHEAEEVAKRVHNMVHKKTISAETAVQVALLNNKGLQAAYADVGVSAAEVWQQMLPENPRVSVGLFGLSHPEVGAFRAIEGMIAANILHLITYEQRVGVAKAMHRKAQMDAALATLKLAVDTRRAWIDAVSAFETVHYLKQGQQAADAASELAKKLGETGTFNKAKQAREHAFYSELTGQRAQADLAAKLAKEKLTRLMGLWGSDVTYYVPDKLPGLPGKLSNKSRIERDALQNRVDLQISKLELESVAKSYKLTDATRYVTDLELLGGAEYEREKNDDDETETTTTPQVEVEFKIPIFDSGKPRLRKGELAYMRAANLLAEKAVNIRSEARSAYTAYRARYDIARHYKNSVLPLRITIEEESVLTYNGMITNTFELLADTRAKINTFIQSVGAKREFWLADADLNAAIYGGGASEGGGGASMAMADSGGGGH